MSSDFDSSDDPFGWVGATLDGKYRIDAVVGKGGFGTVYRAHHLGFEEKVAVKCLRLPKELTGAERDRFRDTLVAEGRLQLQLSRATANVVQALDVGAAVSPNKVWTPYLVLEWLEGKPLDRELQERRQRGAGGRSLGEALELLEGPAGALAIAHDLGIAHRDIKPANLFLTHIAGRLTLKVLDFGIAKVLSESDSLTRAFEETGGHIQAFTARYGAPEQFSRRFGATGPWTDVFALALVFEEVIVGAPLLEGMDAAQLFVAASDKDVRPTLRSRGCDAGDEVEAVLATALSVEPRERYPNARAFWEALTAAARRDPARLALRAPVIDESRPTRELHEDPALAPTSTPFEAGGSGAAPSTGSRGAANAREAGTELASSHAIGGPASGPVTAPRSGTRTLPLVAVSALAAGACIGAVLWLARPKPERVTPPASHVQAPAAAPDGAAPAPSSQPIAPAHVPSGSGESVPPPSRGGVEIGRDWPGAPWRDVASGTLATSGAFVDSFRVVRQSEPRRSAAEAFGACSAAGLSLCTEPQWELACGAFPEVGRTPSFVDALDAGAPVSRGGASCGAREATRETTAARAGLCCDRAIAVTSKNLQKQFLSSTAGVLEKLESALNQRDTAALTELFDEKVKLDGVERSRAQVLAQLAQSFKAEPDLQVTHPACDITVQANKVVKRSKRGRKVATYETLSWTASCAQLRHRGPELASSHVEYVFSPASRVRGLSGKADARESE